MIQGTDRAGSFFSRPHYTVTAVDGKRLAVSEQFLQFIHGGRSALLTLQNDIEISAGIKSGIRLLVESEYGFLSGSDRRICCDYIEVFISLKEEKGGTNNNHNYM